MSISVIESTYDSSARHFLLAQALPFAFFNVCVNPICCLRQ